jgi:predicted phosphodiesterase
MLLHISDIHAQPGRLPRVAEIVETLSPHPRPTHLVVSGDLGHQGNHATLGARFVRELADELGLDPTQIVVCPGNHDIGKDGSGGPSFDAYHREMAKVLRNAERANPTAAKLYSAGDYDFAIFNSAHHLDWRHGHVLMSAIHRLPSKRKSSIGVAVVHHHLLPYDDGDHSHITNTYPLLTYLTSQGYDVLLHGHRHVSTRVRVESMHVIGVGSVNFPPASNINNQFNLISPGQFIRRFRFVADKRSPTGVVGAWVVDEVGW